MSVLKNRYLNTWEFQSGVLEGEKYLAEILYYLANWVVNHLPL